MDGEPAERADGSELMYQRNRYDDPASGRFTQQDPIGLAGGSNLYGFGGSDQLNYSDPFGLCPPTRMDEVFACIGHMLAPAQGPLEKAGAVVAGLPLIGLGAAAGVGAEVLELGQILQSGAGSGIVAAGGVATRVAAAVDGSVSSLSSSAGFKVTVESAKNIVVRIKTSGDMRVSIDKIGSLTRDGFISSNRAVTHLKNLTSAELLALIERAKQFLKAKS